MARDRVEASIERAIERRLYENLPMSPVSTGKLRQRARVGLDLDRLNANRRIIRCVEGRLRLLERRGDDADGPRRRVTTGDDQCTKLSDEAGAAHESTQHP